MKQKYHISDNLLEDINKLLQGKYDTSQEIKLREHTPKILVKYDVKDLPMLMNSNHILDNILTKEQAKNMNIYKPSTNYHGLGVKKFIEAIESIDNPLAVYQWKDKKQEKYGEKDFVILIKMNNEDTVVPIYIETEGNYNYVRIATNKVKTIFSNQNLEKLYENRVKDNKMKKIYPNKKTK